MTAAAGSESATMKKPKSNLSEKQVAARRANAKKSTGPKTPGGKARVRENAIVHGAYARSVTCITHGPLAEDLAEVEAFQAHMLEDLDPRTAVERALAVRSPRLRGVRNGPHGLRTAHCRPSRGPREGRSPGVRRPN